ncbi:uncharacterized protein LOC133198321 [Saccostrea echinata]|uniref:uncharacterized protein LOC133198321 n=1 Tax=Saccostrea echinata TaxID=191078 RepID=UPI002A83000E|nr:uncharacterized protein LOC133198321 [Saccostrea echinata]
MSDSIFIKWSTGGKPQQPLDNSALNKGLGRLWNKMFDSNKPISTTRLRKSVVTEVRRAVPTSRDVLARHMSHEPSTADRYYHMSDKSKMAVPVSRLITAVMEGESEASRTTKQIAQTSSIQEISQTGTEEGSSNPNPTPDSDSPKKTTQTPEGFPQLPPGPHRRRPFSEIEVRTLVVLLSGLDVTKGITKLAVISHLQESEEGRLFLLNMQNKLGSEYQKKIIDRVRTLFRR